MVLMGIFDLDRPWHLYIGMKLIQPDTVSFRVNDTVNFLVDNFYHNTRAVVVWGSALGIEKQVSVCCIDGLCFTMRLVPSLYPALHWRTICLILGHLMHIAICLVIFWKTNESLCITAAHQKDVVLHVSAYHNRYQL